MHKKIDFKSSSYVRFKVADKMILNRQLIRNNKIPTCELINITANEITGKMGIETIYFDVLLCDLVWKCWINSFTNQS